MRDGESAWIKWPLSLESKNGEERQKGVAQQSMGCVVLDSLKGAYLIMPKSKTLLEVLDHLFDLPALRIILGYLDRRQINIRTNQITDFGSFLPNDDQSNFTNSTDGANDLGNLESFVLAVQTKRHLPIG